MKSVVRKIGPLLSLAAVLVLVFGLFIYFRDTRGPQVRLTGAQGYISTKPLGIELSDEGSGLRSVVVSITQGNIAKELLNKTFDSGLTSALETIEIKEPFLRDGPVELRVRATDQAIFPFGAGNVTDQVFTLTYDGTPPRVTVQSTTHNINQGGTGLIVYTVSEDVQKTGIEVGEYFFPGFRQPSGEYVALFAFPHHLTTAEFTPRLVAVDLAGNEGRGGFSFHANARRFRQDSINVSDNFLARVMPQFERDYPDAPSLLDVFLRVNSEMRAQNVAAIREMGRDTLAEPLWRGDFLRMGSAANMAQYADRRSYMYQGQKIDEATHMGVDLASVQQAPIRAGNHGRVIFADFLGIYGNCVILDHGLGLQSIYAHLTRIDVQVGDSVQKGDLLGTSGATGMAGGDHLHFEMTVSGVSVNPIEWWDPQWLRNNITSKFPTVQ
ncbi:M23 family metallopeptidase [Geoalkalibacter sp.]|uniref:M23 family metallopeptidase n=1 Tax=Geoalkalibacter sp. TaxID=3041440 RepID=UPI00272EAD82|nr:M23 family metallopeptidase [Geoalkalibacter sp.]